MSAEHSSNSCPCCSQQAYADCCEPAHLGKQPSPDCESLMRSRYSAYVLQLTDYLVDTTHPDSRNKGLKRNIESSYDSTTWLGLTIESKQNGKAEDKIGKVAFCATFKENGKEGTLRELSRFCRYQSQWVYLDGTIYQ